MRVSLGVLARSGLMIVSIKILDHADTQMLPLFPTRSVRQTSSGGVHKLETATGTVLALRKEEVSAYLLKYWLILGLRQLP